MTTLTDTEKRLLAKMLPEKINYGELTRRLWWNEKTEVLATEHLTLCAMILERLTIEQCCIYNRARLTLHDPVQKHIAALAKVLNVEDV